jgi:hypothetical protein
MRRDMMASSLPPGEGEGPLSSGKKTWDAFENC